MCTYTYNEVKEAVSAFLRMGYGDFTGEDYIDSLAAASMILKDGDSSFDLFSKFFNDNQLVHELNSLQHLEEGF